MTKKTYNNYPFVKFSGSLSLLFTIVGVLFAIVGQLNFLGNERQSIEVVKKSVQPAGFVEAPIIKESKKPKYSFYDELKKRKTELGIGDKGVSRAFRHTASTSEGDSNEDNTNEGGTGYVVQVGAFKKSSDAQKIKKKVESLGYSVRIVPLRDKYLTQAGPFKGLRNAKKAERRLRGQRLDTLIKRL